MPEDMLILKTLVRILGMLGELNQTDQENDD